ncbi:MAG: ATP-binding cassette domain-containing protein [Flavipsychrobacter sp.]
MRLSLERIIPSPIKDKVGAYDSWVWNQKLAINKGEKVLIQAPSGAGKTMLVHMLYGLRNDYIGKINWGVFRMDIVNAEQLSQLRASTVSIVFQDLKLFPSLTVWENVDIKRRLTDTVTEFDTEQWLGRLGLEDRLNTPVAHLSFGEQQRVAIVRALSQPFDWLILDEPFTFLDAFNRRKAIALIKQVVDFSGAGLLMASHDDNDDFKYTRKLLL